MLKKMSDSEKWQLLNQYKGSTLELLVSICCLLLINRKYIDQ